MCPEPVMAAQRIAIENPYVTTEVYDLNMAPEIKDRYQIMSVPCIIINESDVLFGKKTMEELLNIIL